LTGKRLLRVRSPNARIARADFTGRTIAKVEPRGKNLLVHLDDGRAFWTHLRMSGSWHVYRTGEKWFRSEATMKVALDVEGFAAVLFNAPVCELLTPAQLRDNPTLRDLGPDASAATFDAAEAQRRLRTLGDLALGEAILRQHAISGPGNVFKSEVLFVLGQDPFVKVADVSDERLGQIVAEMRKLMLQNRYSSARITRQSLGGQGSRWVYGRSGQPCRRCGTRIRMRRQGQLGRSTYYCPRCQGVVERRDPSRRLPSPIQRSPRSTGG
jgi:endonuclease-8